MTETADELSAPLGQKTERRKRRFRLPFTAMQALAVLLGLFLVAFLTVALFTDNPLGGEPVAQVALRKPTADEKQPASSSPTRRRSPRPGRLQTATTRRSPSSTAPAASARTS